MTEAFTTSNAMYNNDLLLYICHLIEDHNLGVILSRLDDRHFRSRYLPQKKLIIINTNWWNPSEVPFMAAHELGHCINGDKGEITIFLSAFIRFSSYI